MGFLKNFFTNVYSTTMRRHRRQAASDSFPKTSSRPTCGVARYGDFELSDAVRPSYNLEVVPSAGFRHDVYRDEENRTNVPVLMAAVAETG